MHNNLANRIKNLISGFDPEAEIYLFGSRARGDFKTESDWDVLVITPNLITIEYEKAIREPIIDLELETGEVISLLVYTRNDWQSKKTLSPLFMNVATEGIQL